MGVVAHGRGNQIVFSMIYGKVICGSLRRCFQCLAKNLFQSVFF